MKYLCKPFDLMTIEQRSYLKHGVCAFLLLMSSAYVFAQSDADTTANAAAANTTSPDTSAVALPTAQPQQAQADLQAAYQREYAFLSAQKQELTQQLARLRDNAQAAVREAESAIDAREGQLVGAQNRAERFTEWLAEADRRIADIEDQRGVLDATYLQASATLAQHNSATIDEVTFNAADDIGKIAQVFTAASQILTQAGQVRREPGEFYLADGSQVSGTIVKVGNIAAYGVSDNASGVLAPAGEQRLKLWPQPASEVAQQLVQGNSPQSLKIFLFESLTKAVEEKQARGVIGTIDDGGVIAWIIAALGLVAVLLIVFRLIFLRGASADTSKIIEQVGEMVSRGHNQAALDACKKRKGATARVVAAALRNLDREREHLEDIISEAILHESSHLNRFGAMILVIAAVTPLLGLLGTVTGMIATFDVITEFGTGDPKLLSGGISIALITTEVGLAVAIPALLFGNLLSGWAEGIKDDMEKAALRIINLAQQQRLTA